MFDAGLGLWEIGHSKQCLFQLKNDKFSNFVLDTVLMFLCFISSVRRPKFSSVVFVQIYQGNGAYVSS